MSLYGARFQGGARIPDSKGLLTGASNIFGFYIPLYHTLVANLVLLMGMLLY